MSIAEYMSMQKQTYADLASTREGAELAVHPQYANAKGESYATLAYILTDYAQRSASFQGGADIEGIRRNTLEFSKDIKILDFGCGVGRLMEALVESGYTPDGVDISPEMMQFAQSSEQLRDSACRFFLSRGDDCGEAPKNHYDLAYSVLCFQHICVRTIRNSILAAIRDSLQDEGVFCLQVQYFPGIDSGRIPGGHASWIDDKINVSASNSSHDVWVTADMLSVLLQDFSRLFSDIRLQFVDLPKAEFQDAGGGRGVYQHLFISGCKAATMCRSIYRSR